MPTMSAPHDTIDELPQLDDAAAPAPPIGNDPMHILLANQAKQTNMLEKLQKSVLTSRTMINELVVANNDLREEVAKLRGSVSSDQGKNEETSYAAQTMLSVAGKLKNDVYVYGDILCVGMVPTIHVCLSLLCIYYLTDIDYYSCVIKW